MRALWLEFFFWFYCNGWLWIIFSVPVESLERSWQMRLMILWMEFFAVPVAAVLCPGCLSEGCEIIALFLLSYTADVSRHSWVLSSVLLWVYLLSFYDYVKFHEHQHYVPYVGVLLRSLSSSLLFYHRSFLYGPPRKEQVRSWSPNLGGCFRCCRWCRFGPKTQTRMMSHTGTPTDPGSEQGESHLGPV
jgi:hypothetical protein